MKIIHKHAALCRKRREKDKEEKVAGSEKTPMGGDELQMYVEDWVKERRDGVNDELMTSRFMKIHRFVSIRKCLLVIPELEGTPNMNIYRTKNLWKTEK